MEPKPSIQNDNEDGSVKSDSACETCIYSDNSQMNSMSNDEIDFPILQIRN
jgi:hypothetical protein